MIQWFDLLRSPIQKLDVPTQERIYRAFTQLVYDDIYFICQDHELTKDIIQEAFIKRKVSDYNMYTDIKPRA